MYNDVWKWPPQDHAEVNIYPPTLHVLSRNVIFDNCSSGFVETMLYEQHTIFSKARSFYFYESRVSEALLNHLWGNTVKNSSKYYVGACSWPSSLTQIMTDKVIRLEPYELKDRIDMYLRGRDD